MPKRRAAPSSAPLIAAQSSVMAIAAPNAQPLRSDCASMSIAWRCEMIAASASAAPGVLGIGPAATASRAR